MFPSQKQTDQHLPYTINKQPVPYYFVSLYLFEQHTIYTNFLFFLINMQILIKFGQNGPANIISWLESEQALFGLWKKQANNNICQLVVQFG